MISNLSPNTACTLLTDGNLPCGEYKEASPGQWEASASYIALDDSAVPNNIAYYVDGSENQVSTVRLVLNVNATSAANIALDILFSLSSKLTKEVLAIDLPVEIEDAIKSNRSVNITTNGNNLNVEIKQFVKNNGYEVVYTIS